MQCKIKAILFFSFFMTLNFLEANIPWCVYYSDKAPAEAFKNYDLLVFDNTYHPPLAYLKERKKMILGYLSLGGAEPRDFYYKTLKKNGLLLQKNEDWPDERMIDIRNPLWPKMVIETLIPWILQKGFDGVIFDTLDNAEYLESKDPKKYQGMIQAAADLVKGVRLHYPNIPIMVNRAYDILPQIAPYIDMVMAEVLMTDYNFKKKKYYFVPHDEYIKTVKMLHEVKKNNPNISLFSLDYWPLKDRKTVKKIYAEEEKEGFNPFVSMIDLDKVPSYSE